MHSEHVGIHGSNSTGDDRVVDARPNEKMIVFAQKGQVPVQLEHWLRKRQIGVTFSESARVDVGEIRSSGAKYVLVDLLDARFQVQTAGVELDFLAGFAVDASLSESTHP